MSKLEGEEAEQSGQDWIRQRTKPGNWIDVKPDEELPPCLEGWWMTLVHMHQVTFAPEIRRRRDEGRLPDDFVLWGAQLLQPYEGRSVVRLNDEVKCVAGVRAPRDVQKGEQVRLSDFSDLEYLDLHDEELDCGHFTILWTGKNWVGAFDFRSGRAKGIDLLEKALRFAAAARLSRSDNLPEPTIDALHTACELIAKTKLMLGQHPAHKSSSHRSINSAINIERRMGNVAPAFTELFNRLWDARNLAKYATGYDAAIPSQEDIDLVDAMAKGLMETMVGKGKGEPTTGRVSQE